MTMTDTGTTRRTSADAVGVQAINALLEQLVASGIAPGAQAVVIDGSDTIDIATGMAAPDLPMGPDVHFRLWCLTKPMIGWALAQRWRSGDLDLDSSLTQHLSLRDADGTVLDVSLRDVLRHRTRLAEPSIMVAILTPGMLGPAVVDLATQYASHGDDELGYSEYVAWALLDQALPEITRSVSWPDVRFAVDREEFLELRSRIGVYRSITTGIPWLQDRTWRFVGSYTSPALGSLGTLRAAARWYAHVGPEAAKAVAEEQPELHDDAVFGRRCAFGLGFMTRLASHGFGPELSPAAVGHIGWMGTSFAFHDPDRGLTAAVLVNGNEWSEPGALAGFGGAAVEALLADHKERHR